MKQYIFICSHGGIGNQLFQILYARLYAKKYNINKIYFFHINYYKRKAKYELSFLKDIVPANFIGCFLLKCRIPKIIEKLNISKKGTFILMNKHILDNYFQDISFYLEFDRNEILNQISILKNQICANYSESNLVNYNKLNLYHFRLGDFFLSELDQIEYINKNIDLIPDSSVVISNRDDLFTPNIFVNHVYRNNIYYLETNKFSSIEMLILFIKFKNIISNGSTLAFWGSIFGNSTLRVINGNDNNDINLNKLSKLFKNN